MDVRMPVMNGIEATRLITAVPQPPRVLVITTFDIDEYVYDSLRAGASGFLLKDAPEQRLLDAIRIISEGSSLFDANATRRIAAHFAPSSHPRSDIITKAGLTSREVEVLVDLAKGLSNVQIAEHLFVSDATVKTHVARVLSKLQARSRTHAVVMAFESGLVSPGTSKLSQ
jgi:DNA-binding NarL/FixJ family response regulator